MKSGVACLALLLLQSSLGLRSQLDKILLELDSAIAQASSSQTSLDSGAAAEHQCASEHHLKSNSKHYKGCPECRGGKTCSCNGDVKYGYGGTWTAWKSVSGQVQCTNAEWGDPFYGQPKICMCRPQVTSDAAEASASQTGFHSGQATGFFSKPATGFFSEPASPTTATTTSTPEATATTTISTVISNPPEPSSSSQTGFHSGKATGFFSEPATGFFSEPVKKQEKVEVPAVEPKEEHVEPAQTCEVGETYGLGASGECHPDVDNDGVLDLEHVAPEACCLACHPGEHARDDNGRCRADLDKNGIFDRFANEVCCKCDPRRTYGRDSAGRCRTDVGGNKGKANGILDRFAKSICCGEKDLYEQPKPKWTYRHPTEGYGDVTTQEGCESKVAKMSDRNKRDCIACVTEGSKDIEHPERCV